MTSKKQLKERVRTRMAATGERYATARRHIVGAEPAPAPVADHGYRLRGGQHPESAAVANVLAHHGVRLGATGAPMSEALVLGAGGGLGAGYILWEFAAHGSRVVTLGFRQRWNYTDWTAILLDRLGVPTRVERTGGAKGAAAALDRALAAGTPALVLPDRQRIGYWHLPPHLDGHGGHQVVAYAAADGRVHLDDRTLAPLTVDHDRLDDARARVSSYRNLLIVPEPEAGAEIPDDVLRAALLAGLAACAAQVGGASESFSSPAWRKWARLMTDPRNAKGWPRVFADGRALTGALLSVWEGVGPAGMDGGHLRGLYAEFLREAVPLLDAPALGGVADAYDEAAAAWSAVAEAAFPADVPAFGRMRALTAAVSGGITAEGDAGAAEVAAAAAQLWDLHEAHDARPPLTDAEVADLFQAVAAALTAAYEREVHAAAALGAAVA
jgi:hypothetical protein